MLTQHSFCDELILERRRVLHSLHFVHNHMDERYHLFTWLVYFQTIVTGLIERDTVRSAYLLDLSITTQHFLVYVMLFVKHQSCQFFDVLIMSNKQQA